MATLKQLGSWATRARLPVQYSPYWAEMHKGLHLGYRRGPADGQWRVRRYLSAGKYHSEIIGVADDGALVANGTTVLSYAQAYAKAQGPAQGPLTVREACERYVGYLKSHKRTAIDAERRLAKHVLPVLADMRVASLTREQILSVQRKMVKRDPDPEVERRSKVSCNRVMASFRAALNRAYSDPSNSIPSNSAWRVEPFSKVNSSRKIFLDADQQQRLINASEGGFRNLVIAALLTGARPPHELAQLRVRDFAAKSRTLAITAGKTGSRTVVLTHEATEFFAGAAAGRAADALLLPRDDGSAWINRTHIPCMQAAVKRAGLPTDCTIYSLRHSHISAALANGANMQLIAENTGTSLLMIEKFYGKFSSSRRAELIEAGVPRLGLVPGNVTPLVRKR
jgi:integrase